MADVLSLDFETYSEADLTAVGSSRYAKHPSTEVLMLGYRLNRYKTEQWVPAEGQKMPEDLRDMLRDPRIIKRAWNAPFEIGIFRDTLGFDIPLVDWRDTMVMALCASLPGSLDQCGPILRLHNRKDRQGKALMRVFSMPQTRLTKKRPSRRVLWSDEPENWEAYKAYNIQDVDTEAEAADYLEPWDLPQHEWDLWVLDQQINRRGIPVNMTVVRNAIRTSEEILARHMVEMKELTGLDNPNSGTQLLPWLKDQGYQFNDLKKGHIQRAFDDESSIVPDEQYPAYLRVLELRQETSKASIKKFAALDRAVDEDGRLRGALQFAAAGRTWRWGGRIYQPQNLVKPPKWLSKIADLIEAVQCLEDMSTRALEAYYSPSKVMDVISACGRPVIQAIDEHVFVDADLNAIENRVLGWMSGDKKILRVFALGRDPYVDFATYMFGGTYEELLAEYKAGNSSKRTIAKPGVLGCGYLLGAGKQYEDPATGEIMATGLLGYGWNMGVRLTPEQAKLSVDVWRATFEGAVAYWDTISKAAFKCIRTGQRTEAGPVSFSLEGMFMLMHLPSGRSLKYIRPRIEMRMKPWGEKGPTITYEGALPTGGWGRVSTHPGKLTENADQAISRDLLAHGMMLADKRGLDINLHVHDQVLGMVMKKDSDYWLKVLKECMAEPPHWAPDMPLAAAGHVSKYFLKD